MPRLIVFSCAHDGAREPGATAPCNLALAGVDRILTEAEWSEAVCTRAAASLTELARATGADVRALVLCLPLQATVDALKAMPAGDVDLVVEPHLNAETERTADYACAITYPSSRIAATFACAWGPRAVAQRTAGGYSEIFHHWRIGHDFRRRLALIVGQPHPAVVTELGFVSYPGFADWVAQPAQVARAAEDLATAALEAVQAEWRRP